MKAPWAALCLLLLSPPAGMGQSLGSAAEKEHERRGKMRDKGAPSPTVTDADLASVHPKADAPEEPAPPEDAPGYDEVPIPFTVVSIPEEAMPVLPETAAPTVVVRGERYWRKRVSEAQERVERAQRRYDSLQHQIRFGQPLRYNADGLRVIYSIDQMKAKADAAEAELKAAQKAIEDLDDEARRAGALPGWLR